VVFKGPRPDVPVPKGRVGGALVPAAIFAQQVVSEVVGWSSAIPTPAAGTLIGGGGGGEEMWRFHAVWEEGSAGRGPLDLLNLYVKPATYFKWLFGDWALGVACESIGGKG
jgi:hypothetical protein